MLKQAFLNLNSYYSSIHYYNVSYVMYLVIPKLSNTMAEPQSPFSFCAFCNLFQLTQ